MTSSKEYSWCIYTPKMNNIISYPPISGRLQGQDRWGQVTMQSFGRGLLQAQPTCKLQDAIGLCIFYIYIYLYMLNFLNFTTIYICNIYIYILKIYTIRSPFFKDVESVTCILIPPLLVPRRHNMYDGNEEFWVIVKESGKRQETHSYEEIQQKRAKAIFFGGGP